MSTIFFTPIQSEAECCIMGTLLSLGSSRASPAGPQPGQPWATMGQTDHGLFLPDHGLIMGQPEWDLYVILLGLSLPRVTPLCPGLPVQIPYGIRPGSLTGMYMNKSISLCNAMIPCHNHILHYLQNILVQWLVIGQVGIWSSIAIYLYLPIYCWGLTSLIAIVKNKFILERNTPQLLIPRRSHS